MRSGFFWVPVTLMAILSVLLALKGLLDMGMKMNALLKSPWVFHMSTGSCNNCDIEIIDCLTPRF